MLFRSLPRDHVGMVLQLGEQNLVAGLQMLKRPGRSDEVDALGGAPGEDDFLRGSGINEFRDAFARGFVSVGGAVAQLMDAAVDVGVVVLVVAHEGVDDLARFLAGGRVVEVDQPMPVDFLIEDWEVGAESGPIWRVERHSGRREFDGKLAGDPNSTSGGPA